MFDRTSILRRLLTATLAAGVWLFVSGIAWAADEQELDVAKSLLDGAQYSEAAARFGRLLDPTSPVCPGEPELSPRGCRLTEPAIIQRARGYFAHALVALDRDPEAKHQMTELLRETPTFSPSPAVFPQKVIELYIEVKKELEAETTALTQDQQRQRKEREDAQARYDAYVKKIEELAGSETVIVPRSRFIAALPLGIGQFHNDNVGLGVMFASLEGSAIVVAVVTGALHADLAARALTAVQSQNEGAASLQTAAVETDLLSLRVANNLAMGALGVSLIAGLIEAQISFEAASKEVRPRKLPDKPTPPPPSFQLTGVPGRGDAHGLGLRFDF